jgi:hypothetical protein
MWADGSWQPYNGFGLPIMLYYNNMQSYHLYDGYNKVIVSYENVRPLGIVSHTLNNLVRVYPNPTAGELRIESGELKIENVAIYDISGKIQKTENWETKNTIDISYLPAGVYFLRITTEQGEVVRKVLKE